MPPCVFFSNVSTLEEDWLNPPPPFSSSSSSLSHHSFLYFLFPFKPPLAVFFFFWWRSPLFLNGTSLLRAYRVSKLRLPLQSCSFKQPIHTKRQLAALMKTSLKLQELQAWDAFIRSMENAFPSCQFL